jgi:hypothetical protein
MTRAQFERFVTRAPHDRSIERFTTSSRLVMTEWIDERYVDYAVQLAWECVQETERLAREEQNDHDERAV